MYEKELRGIGNLGETRDTAWRVRLTRRFKIQNDFFWRTREIVAWGPSQELKRLLVL